MTWEKVVPGRDVTGMGDFALLPACTRGHSASETTFCVRVKAGSISLPAGMASSQSPTTAQALFKEVTEENMAQGKDQPLLRHLLKPPELRQWMDEHQEDEGHRAFTTQWSQQPAAAVLAGSMFFPG